MSVVLLCAVVTVMLWLFLGYHLNLIRIGYTTNESAKAASYRHYIESSIDVFEQWIEIKKKDPKANPP